MKIKLILWTKFDCEIEQKSYIACIDGNSEIIIRDAFHVDFDIAR